MRSIMAQRCSAKAGPSRSPRPRAAGRSSWRTCRRGRASRRIEAPIVVLAAGTLGTNELLLRAQQRGLKLSAKLGEKFSANGDDLVFAEQSRRAGQCRCHGLSAAGATWGRARGAPQHGADRPRRRAWPSVGSRRHDADHDGCARSPQRIAATENRGSPAAVESKVSTATS